MPLSIRPWSRARRGAPVVRHRCSLEVGLLEGRLLMAGPGDVTAPTTVASLVGTAGQNGYFRGPITVNFSATDPDDPSDTLATFSSVNGGAPVAGNSLSLANDGIYTVAYFSKDTIGNVETAHTEVVRIDRTPPTITESVSPSSLFPPNHKPVAVTVTGQVVDNLSGVVSTVTYRVIDEYGQFHATDSVGVDTNGNYRFVIDLPASRRGQDKDGRQFMIDVTATDFAGNQTTTSQTVTVLHDRGNHNGRGDQQATNSGASGIPNRPSGTGTFAGKGGRRTTRGHSHKIHGNGGRHGHATQNQGQGAPSPVLINTGNHGSDSQGHGGNHGNGNGGDHGNGNGNHGNGHNK